MTPAERPLEPDFLRAVFDNLGAGVHTVDRTGRITAANPCAQGLVGHSEERMLGRDLHELLHRRADGGTIPREGCRVLAVIDSGRSAQGSEHFLMRSDGTTVPVFWAATPLWRQGGVDGAAVVFHDFSPHRQAAEQTRANLAALEELTERLSLVAEVSAVLTSTLDIPEILHRLVRLLVPNLGDRAAVDLPDGREGGLRRIAFRASADADADVTPDGSPLPDLDSSALSRAMDGRRPLLLNADDLAQEPDTSLARSHRALLDRLGSHSAVVVTLGTRGRAFGVLTVARTGDQPPYTEAEVVVLADIGRRTGLVMDNAQLFDQQRHVAETMQRQLLTPLPQVDHLRLAARYRPAQSAAQVGGDWYDAFLLSDGVMAMAIGDVVGHDLRAAAHMAEVRNMLRALAWDRREPPSVIIRRLDEVMTHTSDAPMATVVFGRLEGPDGGPWRLHWANAGHPPPLLVAADGSSRYLAVDHDPLLGMSATLHLGIEWGDYSERLPPRSTILLYTDGLVESRNRPIDVGLAQLRRHASVLAHLDLEDFCDGLLERIAPSGDDVALLALRLPRAGEGADEGEPPRQHAHSPADSGRAAPGSQEEQTPVRDTSDPEPDSDADPDAAPTPGSGPG